LLLELFELYLLQYPCLGKAHALCSFYYVGVRYDDPTSGTRKVDVGKRLAHAIDPTIQVFKIFDSLISENAFEAVKRADYVSKCVDRDGVRSVLNELCAAYSRAYFDLATDIPQNQQLIYGGRVCELEGR
jgi:hypothetical protein